MFQLKWKQLGSCCHLAADADAGAGGGGGDKTCSRPERGKILLRERFEE